MASLIEEFARTESGHGRGLFLQSASKTLVGVGTAGEAVKWLHDRQAVILGFEGFRTNGFALTPLLEYIADFSTIEGSRAERVARSAEAALRVLANWQRGPEFVEFVYEQQADDAGPTKVFLEG